MVLFLPHPLVPFPALLPVVEARSRLDLGPSVSTFERQLVACIVLTGLLLGAAVGTQFRVAEASQLPDLRQLEDFDGFVIPGSRFNATDDEPWIEPLCETIRAAHAHGKALFGICFGHQVIAKALGGVAGAALPYNFTVDDIELRPLASRLLGGRTTIALYKSHGQQVLAPPPGATVIARSTRTPVEMYTLDNVFCCQGHPEFVSAHTSSSTICDDI